VIFVLQLMADGIQRPTENLDIVHGGWVNLHLAGQVLRHLGSAADKCGGVFDDTDDARENVQPLLQKAPLGRILTARCRWRGRVDRKTAGKHGQVVKGLFHVLDVCLLLGFVV
jgi:hypothetical protein